MNEINQTLVDEFKLRIKLDGNEEDENLTRILQASVSDLIMKVGPYTIEENPTFKELVFERSRYVYNDALEYFDTNFVSQLTSLAINMASGMVDGGGNPSNPSELTREQIVEILGYNPANENVISPLDTRVTNNTNSINVLNTSVMSNTNAVNQFNVRLTTLNSTLDALATRVTTLENRPQVDLTPVNNRLTSLEQFDVSIGERVTNLENSPGGGTTDLTQVNNRLITLEEDTSTLETDLASTTYRVSVLESRPVVNLRPITDRLGVLETEQRTNVKSVNNIQPDVNGNVTIEIGDGQGVDSNYSILEEFELTKAPNTFANGETLTIVNRSTASSLYTSIYGLVNTLLGTNSDPGFINLWFKVSTYYNANTLSGLQNIEVYTNTASALKLYTFSRISNGNASGWTNFTAVAHENSYAGNPNGLTGIKGSLIRNTLTGDLYINTTPNNNTLASTTWVLFQEYKTPSEIREDSTNPIRTEVVSSLPTSNLNTGRIVFDSSDNTFRGYNGGEWV